MVGARKMVPRILLGFGLCVLAWSADRNRDHRDDETGLPIPVEKLSPEEEMQFLKDSLGRIENEITNLPPQERAKNVAVKRTQENIGTPEPSRRPATDFNTYQNLLEFWRRSRSTADEVTELTGDDMLRALRDVKDSGQIQDFYNQFRKGRLNRASDKLEKEGILTQNAVVDEKQTTVIKIDDDTADIGFALALYKLDLARLKAEAEARERAQQTVDQATRDAQLSQTRLSNSIDSSGQFTNNPLSFGESMHLASNYLDLAAKQINNSTALQGANRTQTNTPVLVDTELNKLFEGALNAANSLDLTGKGLDERMKPFRDLITSKAFLENGVNLMGRDNAQALVAAVQAADLLNETSGQLNSKAVEFLANAFNLGTSLGAPPCVGCVESAGADYAAKASNYKAASEEVDASTQNWIDEAFEIVDNASKGKKTAPRELTALLKGRSELEKLLATLKLYKSQGVLNSLEMPLRKSMARQYKSAVETAAGILFVVRQRKIVAGDSLAAEKRVVKKSASDLLQKLKGTRNPAGAELALREFFEVDAQNEARALWRRHEEKNYKKLRSATAEVIMSRSLALMKGPSFESINIERAALAYLVTKAFENIQSREAKRLKDQKLRLGLQNLDPIKMNGDKRPASKDKVLLTPKAPETPDQGPQRYPSFGEEE